jgi:uncharacterized repeat protein (TIGR01451 family)
MHANTSPRPMWLKSFLISFASAATILIAVLVSGATAEASTYTLTSSAPVTNWSDVTKWNGGTGTSYPGQSAAGDTVVVNLGTTLNVDVTPFPVILQMGSFGPVNISSGKTLTLQSSSTLTSGNTINVPSGATFATDTGANITSFNGNVNVSGGTWTSNGSLTFNAGQFTFSGGTLNGSGTIGIGSSTSMTMSGATSAMTINATTISNAGSIYVSSTANSITLSNSAQITNSGTLDFQGSQAFSAGGTITNTGTINSSGTVSPGSSLVMNAAVVNNGGAVNAGASHLTFLNLSDTNGTYTNVGAGQLNFGIATINAGTTTLAGSTAIYLQNVTINSGATVNAVNISKITNPTSGSGTLNVSGTFNWTGGIWNGPALNLNGPATFDATLNSISISSGTVTNNNTITYTASSPKLFSINGGTLVNASSKTFTIGGDIDIGGTTSGQFTNNGTLEKTAGTGYSRIAAKVVNDLGGIIKASNGHIALNGGGTTGGSPSGVLYTGTSASNGIAFESNTFTILNGAPAGTGEILVNGGTLSLTASITHGLVRLQSGTITGPGNLTVGTTFTWDAGTMSGVGQTVISNGATGTHGANGLIFLDTRTLTIDGTFSYNPGSPSGSDLTISNAGKIALSATGSMSIAGDGFILNGAGSGNQMFISGGSLLKNGGSSSASTRIDVSLNMNAGSVVVSNGTLDLHGGGSITGGTIQNTAPSTAINVSLGSLNVSSPATWSLARPLNVNGGTLTNAVGFTAAQGVTVSAGALQGAGAVVIPSGATFWWKGGAVDHNAGGSVTVQSGGVLNIDTTTTALIGNGLNFIMNSGSTGTWPGTNSLTLLSGTLNFGGTFDMQASNDIIGGASIINTGTLKKTLSTSTMNVAPVLQNNGTLQIDAGALVLKNGGSVSHSGIFNMNGASTIVDFFAGSHTLTNATPLQGTGTLRISGGTVTTTAAATAPNLDLSGGTLSVGANNFGVSGTTKWNSGTISGTTGVVTFTGALNLLTTGGKTANAKLVANNTTASGTGLLTINNTFTSNGTFDNSADYFISGSGTLQNNGTFKKSAGTGQSVAPATFNNAGSVSAQVGNLVILASGTDSGNYDALSGATLSFSGGTRTFNAASSISPVAGGVTFLPGTYTINGAVNVAGQFTLGSSGGTVTLNSPSGATVGSLGMSSGTLNGTANLTLGTSLASSFSGGTITGSGQLIIPAGASFSISALTTNPTLDGRAVVASGIVTLFNTAFPLVMSNAASWQQNGGTFFINGDLNIGSAGSASSITTTGTGIFKKISGAGTSSVAVPFTNAGGTVQSTSGTLDFAGGFTQSSGTATVGAGTLASSSPLGMTFNGGTINGSGTLNTTIVNNSSAALNPSGSPNAGTINITGNYTQGSGASLTTDLFGNASFDKLTVGGAATLAGSYTATLQGGFTPSNATTFDVLTFASRTGDFASKTLPTYASGGSMTAAYVTSPANALRLTAVVTQADIQPILAIPTSVNHTQNFTIGVTVKNNGTSTATSVSTTVNFSNANFVSSNALGGTCSGTGPVTCTFASIASGSAGSVSITLNAANNGTITTSATASAAEFDPVSNNTSGPVNITVNPVADLSITVTDSPDPVNANSNVTYTVTGTNAGPDSAASQTYNFSFTGGTFVSASGGGLTCGTSSCSGGSLGSGGTTTLTIVGKAQAQGGTMTLNVTASSTTVDLNTPNNSAAQSTVINAQADLLVVKTLVSPLTAGQNTTYSVSVKNLGPSDAVGVVVSDPAQPNLTFVSNSGGCTSAYPCTLGTLTPNQIVTVTSVYAVSANASGSISNTASATTSTADPFSSNNSSTATGTVGVSTDLAITKTLSGTLNAGQNGTYTITVTNNGPSTATSVGVADVTPAGLTFVSNSGACTSAYPCAIGTLNTGQSASITSTYAVAPSASGSIANTATVSAGTPDPNTADNSATATGTVAQLADLAVTKSGPASAFPGSNINYVINVTNNGPADASAVTLTDPTPAGLTFVSATGACTALPCTLGTLTPAQQSTVTVTYSVNAAGTSVTNIATVSSTTTDHTSSNNSASVTTTTGCPSAPTLSLPAGGATNVPTTGSLSWLSSGATTYNVYFGPAGSGCNTFATNTSGNSFNFGVLLPNTKYEWRVESLASGCPTVSSACSTFTTISQCVGQPPTLVAPANGANVASPVAFTWSSVPGAVSYTLFAAVNGGVSQNLGTTNTTTLTASLADGSVTWYVVVNGVNNCAGGQSAVGSFTICSTPAAPAPAVVGEVSTSQAYSVVWDAIAGASKYEVDEASDANFASLTAGFPKTVTTTSVEFQHNVTQATAFFYRVRAFSACGQKFGPNSNSVRVVIVPLPPPAQAPSFNAPAGSNVVVVRQIFIPGFPDGTFPFTVTIDQPWLSVSPLSGFLPPAGITLTLSADPANLPNGTITGTIVLSIGASSSGIVARDNKTVTVPVSVNLTTPVATVAKPAAVSTALVIPSIGHLDGISSKWQSDIRVTNTGTNSAKYQLTFTPEDPAKAAKQTTITAEGGGTVALDDIVKNWYGVGALGESSNGVLQIAPLDNFGRPATPDVAKAAVASSRTYNVTAQGTLGQFIPAIPFANFIGKAIDANKSPVILGLQQIAESSAYRTNVGVVEASGQPAEVMLSVFDGNNKKLLDFPMSLKGNEQKQFNSFLAQNKISVADGRIEAKVTGGDGKISVYASVVDNKSGDPLLVSGVALNALTTDHYVLPGVADLNVGIASWRTDMRVFNSGTVPQSIALTFFQQSNAGAPITKTMTVNPGETKALDNVVSSLYNLKDVGGAVHVTSTSPANLVVTGRTYNQTAEGTFGQFIPAVTSADAAAKDGRVLNVLQVEESTRYRTNIGIAEVTGKPATVEVTAILPGSKAAPRITFDLAANEFWQRDVLHEMGYSNVYNVRIQLRVISGEGRIAAYGSVIDMQTQDPTYVPAQ